jgi:outer membrane lipoprotein-sorting protein
MRRISDFGITALVFALVAGSFVPAPAQSSTYTLDQVLAKMDEVGKAFRSMQAVIERTKVTVIVNDKAVDSGMVYFMRRGKDPRIMLQITKPEQQRMLIDMGKALLYFPKLKQVQEYLLGKNQDKAEFMLIGFGQSREDIKRAYESAVVGEEVIDGQKTSVLELKPRDPKASALFTSIRLWMDQQRWIPVQVKTTEAGGDYMVLKFTNIKMNQKIPDSSFDLKLPKDVHTIKM